MIKFRIIAIMILSILIISCKKLNSNRTIINQIYYNNYIIAGIKDTANNFIYNNDTTIDLLSDFNYGDRELKDSIDFNKDNIFDLLLINDCGSDTVETQENIYSKVSHEDASLKVLNSQTFAISGPFSYNDTINNNSLWLTEIQIASCSSISGCKSMIWMNNDNKYESYKFLGFRFINGNDTLYGWARISPSIVVFDYSFTKK